MNAFGLDVMRTSIALIRASVWGCRSAVVVVLAAVSSAGCSAMSSMGQARVEDASGIPCFSLAGPIGAAQEMDLQGLYVSETKSQDWRSLPAELWAIDVQPAGGAIRWRADACIRYGDLPAGTSARVMARPLQLHHVYVVLLSARPSKEDRSNTLGYKAEFCVVETEGKAAVRQIQWDPNANRWRREVCDKK